MVGTVNKLGVGLRFPPVTGQGWGWVVGVDAVDQAVRAVLLTEPGERISLETRAQIQKTIADALPRDETRIKLLDVAVTADPRDATLVRIAIRYQAPPDPGPRSLVYPFYLDAGAA
jgi:phage baseplate assembly protein W